MANWVRFAHQDDIQLGILEGDIISIHSGDIFDDPKPTGATIAIDDVTLLAPYQPKSVIGLWNNFHERADKEGQSIPATPLYFMKPVCSVIGPGDAIKSPVGYQGRVIFEAELGIVMARTCVNVDEDDALNYVFGYTCVNDVTAVGLLNEDPAFQQWTRCKGFNTFTPVGPWITTDLSPDELVVQAHQNGRIRQNYPVSDMIFKPASIVSLISRYQTLQAGDLIACGTSVGARPMKPGDDIEVVISGIGHLKNLFE